MKKIETIFDRGDDFKVIPKVRAGCEWVFRGEGIPTEKLDGTNVRLTVAAYKVVHIEKRRNPTKEEKAQGIEPGYVDASRNDPSDKHIFRAADNTDVSEWTNGLYECEAVGPKIQGNPLELPTPRCYAFKFDPVILADMPRNFDAIKEYIRVLESRYSPGHLAEGIVFHHPDGRMAKIKRKDFPKHTELNSEDAEKLWESGEGMMKNPIKPPD